MVGFEPTPSERNRFQVYRLNHSATSADCCRYISDQYMGLYSHQINILISATFHMKVKCV